VNILADRDPCDRKVLDRARRVYSPIRVDRNLLVTQQIMFDACACVIDVASWCCGYASGLVGRLATTDNSPV
jgi:hypothetical protein